ncbi:hypothetical protein HID58_030482, partial [Brassica napus]
REKKLLFHQNEKKKKKNSIATDLPPWLAVLLTAATLRRRSFFFGGRPALSLGSDSSFCIGFAGFCFREGMASLASLSPALCLREGMASLASRSLALCLREGMASLASRSPAFSQVYLRSRAFQLFFLPLFLSLRGLSSPLGCMWRLKVSRMIRKIVGGCWLCRSCRYFTVLAHWLEL